MGWFMGAGLGFMLGGPLGAVVGGALQSFMGSEFRRGLGDRSVQSREEAAFVTYLTAIMTKIALADGRLDQSERQVIHNFFAREIGFSGLDLRYIDSLIEQTRIVNPDMGMIARSFRSNASHEQVMLLLDVCQQIAIADGKVTVSEEKEIDYLASYLGVSKEEHDRIKTRYAGTGRQRQAGTPAAVIVDDYSMLGVSKTASASEVKAAYRQMAAQYHPDKVTHLGKELIDFAGKKFIEINKAYENIKKEKGF